MITETIIALTPGQVEALSELNKTVYAASKDGRLGIVFAKVDIDEGHIQAVFWPHEPGKQLIQYMQMLAKYYDLKVDTPPQGEKG